MYSCPLPTAPDFANPAAFWALTLRPDQAPQEVLILKSVILGDDRSLLCHTRVEVRP